MSQTLSTIVILLAATSALGQGGIDIPPDLQESTAHLMTPGVDLVLMVRPDGEGTTFWQTRDEDGVEWDGRVVATMRDGDGVPMEGVDAEDLWLESNDGGLVWCPPHINPDGPSNYDGMVWWSLPPAAGGHSEGLCQVMIYGYAMTSQTGMSLYFNSPDIDGDLQVGLADLSLFTEAYFGDYDMAVDLDYDSIINLADLSRFADSWGVDCQ